MSKIKRSLRLCLFLLVYLSAASLQAAPRDAGKDGAVLKLQSMVKSLTTEREAAKAETAKITAELEQLKKDDAKKIAAAEVAKGQVDAELTAQKETNARVQETSDKTHARLLEVIEKYKELQQAKAELGNQFTALTAKQQATEQQLTVCGEHNVKLYQAGKEMLDRYENKGTIAGLLQDEPILQFNSVEMENIVQEYEDKLIAGQLKNTPQAPAP